MHQLWLAVPLIPTTTGHFRISGQCIRGWKFVSENQRNRCARTCIAVPRISNLKGFSRDLCSRNISWIIEALIALAVKHAAPRDESLDARTINKGRKNKRKPGREFLMRRRDFLPFSIFRLRETQCAAHCDSVGYVYVRAAFESCETKPLSVLALPRST